MSETPRKATITILLSEYTELTQLRTERDALAADNAKLRKATQAMLENYIELKRISLAIARSDAPNWIGSRMTPDDDIHVIAVRNALSTPPSDAEWFKKNRNNLMAAVPGWEK